VVGGLPPQLQVAAQVLLGQLAALDRSPDGTPGLAAVAAVAEPTTRCERPDVSEGFRQAGTDREQSEFAHARHVDEQPTTFQHEQLPSCRRVTAFAGMTDSARCQVRIPGEAVDEGGLADARRAEQATGRARWHASPDFVDPFPGEVAHWNHRNVEGHPPHFRDHLFDDAAFDEVGLGEHHDGLDVSLTHHDQVALEPRHIEIEVAGLHDQRHVDVGRNHLQLDVATCNLAPQERPARQQFMDDRVRARVQETDADPVADARQLLRTSHVVPVPPSQFRWNLADLVADEVAVAVDCRDPGEARPRVAALSRPIGKPVIEAESLEFHRDKLPDRGSARHPVLHHCLADGGDSRLFRCRPSRADPTNPAMPCTPWRSWNSS
jgi:hypothetical protein